MFEIAKHLLKCEGAREFDVEGTKQPVFNNFALAFLPDHKTEKKTRKEQYKKANKPVLLNNLLFWKMMTQGRELLCKFKIRPLV